MRFREEFRFLTSQFYTRCKYAECKIKEDKLITVDCDGCTCRLAGAKVVALVDLDGDGGPSA